MKWFLLIFFMLGFAYSANAVQADSIMEKGNQYYEKKNYDSAIAQYQQLIENGFIGKELFYNLGCAYYKQNQIPESILYFEKAKLLAPQDDDIDFNLNLARQMVVDKIDPLPRFFLNRWIMQIFNLLNVNQWGFLSIVFFIIFLGSLGIYLFYSGYRLRKWAGITACLWFLFAAIGVWAAFVQKGQMLDHADAIVMEPSLTVLSSPDESGTALFVIHEGLKVSVEDQVNEWVEVKLANGNKGWVKKEAIKSISID